MMRDKLDRNLMVDMEALYGSAEPTVMVEDFLADMRALYGNDMAHLTDDVHALYGRTDLPVHLNDLVLDLWALDDLPLASAA